eukprot:INCI15772.2.p1 GENE.INCI15772.2~~INCI15772.2.p1  ORF type:complete len:147 (-),score=26.86 INCI15772.2:272-655(-)
MSTVEEVAASLTRLGYNMLDVKKTAQDAVSNPSAEYKALKVLAHKALATGRDNVNKGDMSKANNSFAFAYQMRCTADWIWKNLMKNKGDLGHAKFVEKSRLYGKLAAGNLPKADIAKTLAAIAKIHD